MTTGERLNPIDGPTRTLYRPSLSAPPNASGSFLPISSSIIFSLRVTYKSKDENALRRFSFFFGGNKTKKDSSVGKEKKKAAAALSKSRFHARLDFRYRSTWAGDERVAELLLLPTTLCSTASSEISHQHAPSISAGQEIALNNRRPFHLLHIDRNDDVDCEGRKFKDGGLPMTESKSLGHQINTALAPRRADEKGDGIKVKRRRQQQQQLPAHFLYTNPKPAKLFFFQELHISIVTHNKQLYKPWPVAIFPRYSSQCALIIPLVCNFLNNSPSPFTRYDVKNRLKTLNRRLAWPTRSRLSFHVTTFLFSLFCIY